jgi:hypothetical protein
MSSLAKKRRASTKEKITLLLEATGTWNYADIMKYFGFSYGKANNIMRDIVEEKGNIKYYEGKGKRRVRIDDVLNIFGTNRMTELGLLMSKEDMGGTNGA